MPYRRPGLVKCWYACLFFFVLNSESLVCTIDYLQARLTLETSQLAFSELPFRFAEVAKVILDVLVVFSFFLCILNLLITPRVIKVLQMISKTQKNFVHF